MTVYRTQPIPFIDEIFHIRQAKLYCATQFNQVNICLCTLALKLYNFCIVSTYVINWQPKSMRVQVI